MFNDLPGQPLNIDVLNQKLGELLGLVSDAVGLIPPDHRDGFPEGWQYWLERIRELAERKQRKGP